MQLQMMSMGRVEIKTLLPVLEVYEGGRGLDLGARARRHKPGAQAVEESERITKSV